MQFNKKMEKIKKEDIEFGNWIREFYNRKAKNISDNGYEYWRWFSSPRKIRQYKHSLKSLLFHLQNIEIKNCLEIGCGPGTWTKILLKKYPRAKFLCVDISKEMIKQFEKNVRERRRVKTIVGNFLDVKLKKESFDFIFCSRSIEYIPNKPEVIRKFYNILKNGGKGIIISSPPHPRLVALKRLIRRKIDIEHKDRIFVEDLTNLLRKIGFIKVEAYPILFSDLSLVPNRALFNKLYKKNWNLLSKMFASSYLVRFIKNEES